MAIAIYNQFPVIVSFIFFWGGGRGRYEHMIQNLRTVRTNQNERTTSKRSPQ